jgi:PAS domain S-box-containing protein
MKHYQYRRILARFLLTIILAPLAVILFVGFVGPDISQAWDNAVEYLFVGFEAVASWAILVVTTLASAAFLRPVFHFLRSSGDEHIHDRREAARAVRTINAMPRFITLLSVGGFLLGVLAETILNPEEAMRGPGLWFVLAEGFSAGLFTATLITLNLDSVLFPVKRRVIMAAPEIEQRYRSFYATLFSAIMAMLFFLMIQVMEIASNFLLIGGQGLPVMGEQIMDIPRMMDLGSSMEGIKGLMDVLFIRGAIFFAMAFEIISMIKAQIRNPIKTIQDSLHEVNRSDATRLSTIDVVNNNEFNAVYREINILIARKQVELDSSREQLDTIIRSAADPIITFDEDAKISLFNPAAQRLMGWEESDMIGELITSYLTPPDIVPGREECGCEPFFDFLEDESSQLKRMSLRTIDGTVVPVEANFSSTSRADQDFYTLILRDIRSQLEYEQSLTEARNAAETANRMKSEFLANMSHELRTPLNAILGYTQLMADDQNLTDGQKDKINTISNSGEHLLALINDILDISKIEAGKFELSETAFHLKDFIRDLQDMFSIKCQQKGLSLYVEYIGELPEYVMADLGKLRQIMINLIGNAVKFTAEGGIALAAGRDGDRIRFSVNDTGKGIPEEDQEHILKPFIQSSMSDHEGGTGLGLAISSRFIEMMGSSLELESSPGRGSTFSFAIPLKVSEQPPETRPRQGTVLAVKGGVSPRVLVVDDKLDNRLILKEMLERVGFTVHEAENGQRAVSLAFELRPDCIFMDIKMPVMDGYQAVEKIKADDALRSIPVFALTASAFKHDEQKILESGFDGFLAKPFQQGRLFALIEENSEIRFEYEKPAPEGNGKSPVLNEADIIRQGGLLSGEDLRIYGEALLINDFTRISQWARENKTEGAGGLLQVIENNASAFNEDELRRILEIIQGGNE